MGLFLILAGIGIAAVGTFGLVAVLFAQAGADELLTTALSEGAYDDWEDLSND